MKEIELIKIDRDIATISNHQDFFRMQSLDDPLKYPRVANSDEFIVNSMIEIEDIPIKKIVDHGEIHYIAVTNKVWEYLYYITNPVTAKSQEAKIKKLKSELSTTWNELERTANSLTFIRNTIGSARFFKRLKWAFTGIKL